MGKQEEMGKEKRNLRGNHFWLSSGRQLRCECVVFVFVFCNFEQFGCGQRSAKAAVYRLPMSSHFDKLLNLE